LTAPAGAAPTVRLWVTDPFSADARLTEQAGVRADGSQEPDQVLKVDLTFRDQTIGGFGASLTESSAQVIATLPPGDRDALMTELFAPGKGLSLTFLRQPIGAPDFAASVFSLDDVEPGKDDFSLAFFGLDRDRAVVLPLIRQARSLQPSLLISASPWSPPAWMKTGATMLGASGGVLRDDCYDVYARYLVKFVQGYASEGVPIFALTPQNEPAYGPPQYPGMAWDADSEGRFIRTLGPTLAEAGLATQIWGWDHNYDRPSYARQLLADPDTARWISGTAWHDYGGSPVVLDALRRDYAGKDVWMTEGGLGSWLGSFGSRFQTGVRQGIAALVHGSRSYVLWNLALDDHGGPVVFPNTSNEGLVSIAGGQVVGRNASYYVLGHFTRVVAPGAVRVGLTSSSGGTEAVAFANPDGSTAVVLANPYLNDQTVRIRVGDLAWDVSVPGQGAVSFLEKP
jgi:glucosylceramidase